MVDRFTQSYEDSVDCADVGPYQFEVLFAGRERIEVTEVIAADGTLLQTVLQPRHQRDRRQLRHGRERPAEGSGPRGLGLRVQHPHDLRQGVARHHPGEGKAFQDTGLITMTLDTHEALSVAGPHEVFFGGGLDAMVCAWLAA